jgi:ketosteroid isomerase-like protein
MKRLVLFILAAVALIITPGSVRAGQPSIDELALQSGVVAWVSAWNPGDKPFDLKKLERLYRANVLTREADRSFQSWKEYASTLRPCVEQFVEMNTQPAGDLEVQISEGHAETSFVIHPSGKRRDGSEVSATTRVRLTWAKEGGIWRIAEQKIACSKDSDKAAVVAR